MIVRSPVRYSVGVIVCSESVGFELDVILTSVTLIIGSLNRGQKFICPLKMDINRKSELLTLMRKSDPPGLRIDALFTVVVWTASRIRPPTERLLRRASVV